VSQIDRLTGLLSTMRQVEYVSKTVDCGTISNFSFAKHFARQVFPFQVKLSET
jgi:hypothetical protein